MELIFNDYGQEKELNAKTEEDQIFDALQSMTDGETEWTDLVQRSMEHIRKYT